MALKLLTYKGIFRTNTVDEWFNVELNVLNHHNFLRPFMREQRHPYFFHTFLLPALAIQFKDFPLTIVFINNIFDSFKNIFFNGHTANAMNAKKLYMHFIIFIYPSNKNEYLSSISSICRLIDRCLRYCSDTTFYVEGQRELCRFLSDNWVNVFSVISSTLRASVFSDKWMFSYKLAFLDIFLLLLESCNPRLIHRQ